MLIAIYLKQTDFGQDFETLCVKMQSLEQEFGHFFSYDKEIYQQSIKVSEAIQFQMQQMVMKAPRDVLVVDVSRVYRAANLDRLRDTVEQFKAKFATLRTLRFDPFVLGCTIVAAPNKSDVKSFHFLKNFQGALCEQALIEIGSERQAFAIKNFIQKRSSLIKVLNVVSELDIQIDGSPLK